MKGKSTIIDGNDAAATIAYKLSEVIAIYPITPASSMGESADAWAARGIPNLWGTVPRIQEMQSEAGAAGVVHGALQAGTLATTFTASQGLLLMIPEMYKIAGELTPVVFHVAARAIAAHALSIFGDHSDVMAARATGLALLSSASVQEAMDLALVAHAATLKSRIPFIHFFDGFRTSHEIAKIDPVTDDVIRSMIDENLILAHRSRALTPDHPVIRGTSQNPDVFFQSREAANKFYQDCPSIVQNVMDQFASLTGRQYRLFDYYGANDAERVIVLMGSGSQAARETVDAMYDKGEKVGVLTIHLFRPFSVQHFLGALPRTVKVIAALDRTKEAGSSGEPLYLDIVNAVHEGKLGHDFAAKPHVIGGRYGLASKEFTPAMIKGVFDAMSKPEPKNHFTVGIVDDVTHTSLDYDLSFSTEPADETRAVFYGLGADGTVSANKNSIKIIGEETDDFVQGYFVYDSKKAGAITVSHLRFGKKPIHSSYLVQSARFVGCHQFDFLGKYDVLGSLMPGGIFLLNSPHAPDKVWEHLPRKVQDELIQKKARFFVIDAYKLAREVGIGARINTIMQICFFAITDILKKDQAVKAVKAHIEKTYGRRGEKIVQMNYTAVDRALENMFEVKVPAKATAEAVVDTRLAGAPAFVRDVIGPLLAGHGDQLPVSCMPADGTYPVGTAKWEKRNIAQEIPVWDESICIQCGKCVIVCPHSAIRAKVFDASQLKDVPPAFKSTATMNRDWKGQLFSLQVAPEDCTGCTLCVDVCPVKNKSDAGLKALNMRPQAALREQEITNWEYFKNLPLMDRRGLKREEIRSTQLLEPFFEFSGACAGCGETPYIRLMTQLFGDRALVANATGCSSIFGGNLPTTPWTLNADGRGPAWANSLFEDNAEFGLGFRLAVDQQRLMAEDLLVKLAPEIGAELTKAIREAVQKDESDIYEQRQRVAALKEKVSRLRSPEAKRLLALADYLVKKSVWIMGGDGWAYDIGYGGLDHVISTGQDVNILVLDTEVYSNTGGQMSKSTPRGATAKFASGGKHGAKKDLALMAMAYKNVYVAQVAIGARDEHTLRALLEAEAYPGPSLIIAYGHCIAHGINMAAGLQEQKNAVRSGYWPLFRYNPSLAAAGKNPLHLDSTAPTMPFKEFAQAENRFAILNKNSTPDAAQLMQQAEQDVRERWEMYQRLAATPAADGAKGA